MRCVLFTGFDGFMRDIVVIGGGPSGLAAAYEGVSNGADVVVLERLDRVGGLSRTTPFEGCRYDIGPHRFFTKNKEILQLFREIGGDDLLSVPRLTRIVYNNKYFDYPLTPLNALFGVGVFKSLGIGASYINQRISSRIAPANIETFEDWVVDRFGRRLFETFFKTYTEKVWGIPCTQIGADWAAQRIKGLSLTTAVINALFKPKHTNIKTLLDEFLYPRLGAGQTYEKMAAVIESRGGEVATGRRVTRILREGMRVRAVMVDDGGGAQPLEGRNFLASSPLTEILDAMDPPPPPEVMNACRSLRYRNHIGVNLEVEGNPFPDNWIYVHSQEVKMARIANYRNFSEEMASGPDISPLTVEYFTFPEDELWESTDEQLLALAGTELHRLGIVEPDRVRRGFVVRSEKAYPVIEIGYQKHIDTIKAWLDRLENLLPIGRSGMFKYNNQDHAMATGLLGARTVMGLGRFDPWLVNIDAEYQESAPVA